MFFAGDDLGGDVALVDALVGQHRLSDDVADGVNVRDVGPELFIDLDEPAVGHLDSGLLRVDQFAVGSAANGDEDGVVLLDLGATVLGFERD